MQQAQEYYKRHREGSLAASSHPCDKGILYTFAAEEKALYNLIVPGAGVGKVDIPLVFGALQ